MLWDGFAHLHSVHSQPSSQEAYMGPSAMHKHWFKKLDVCVISANDTLELFSLNNLEITHHCGSSCQV